MTKCKRCGKCCEVIVLNVNSNQIEIIAKQEEKNSDYNFAYRNFKEISKKEAYKINPYLKNWSKEQYIQCFYKCKQYEPISKKCNVYSIRPRVCSGFPWYEYGTYKEQCFYSKKCSFLKDIKKL